MSSHGKWPRENTYTHTLGKGSDKAPKSVTYYNNNNSQYELYLKDEFKNSQNLAVDTLDLAYNFKAESKYGLKVNSNERLDF